MMLLVLPLGSRTPRITTGIALVPTTLPKGSRSIINHLVNQPNFKLVQTYVNNHCSSSLTFASPVPSLSLPPLAVTVLYCIIPAFFRSPSPTHVIPSTNPRFDASLRGGEEQPSLPETLPRPHQANAQKGVTSSKITPATSASLSMADQLKTDFSLILGPFHVSFMFGTFRFADQRWILSQALCRQTPLRNQPAHYSIIGRSSCR